MSTLSQSNKGDMEITYVQIAVIMWHIVCTSVSLTAGQVAGKIYSCSGQSHLKRTVKRTA